MAPDYGKLPVAFEVNQGQTDQQVRFLARGAGYGIFITPTETVLSLNRPSVKAIGVPGRQVPNTAQDITAVVRLAFAGANKEPTFEGQEHQSGVSHYLLGSDPSGWIGEVPQFGRVKVAQIYPGVDAVYYGTQHQLEYDLVVAPGANPSQIKLSIGGADSLKIDAAGNLIIATAVGDLVQHKPVIYQEINGTRQLVDGQYALLADNQIGFGIGAYDSRQTLYIDPLIAYSTFVGGSGWDGAEGIAVDSYGSAYITGWTASTNFPTLTPKQAANAGTYDAFVSKINAAGNALIYSTYLGGSGKEIARAIAIDSAGNAYVTGNTESTNFPLVSAKQATNAGAGDVFVAKLNSTGSALIYSTYLGGSGADNGNAIAVDSAGNAYVTGDTASTNYPVIAAKQATSGGVVDGFLSKLGAAGNTLIYSTYLGGAGWDGGQGIAVDNAGNAHIAGITKSTNFPTSAPKQAANAGGNDAFISKFNAAGSALTYSTYLGGTLDDFGYGLALDSAGNVYVSGYTASTNFPTVTPIQATNKGLGDGFVSKLNTAGNTLLFSTYFGGTAFDYVTCITVDSAGNAMFAGQTESNNIPLLGAIQAGYSGQDDVFLAKLNAAGSALTYSTYFGGTGYESANGIATDIVGNAYVAGQTESTNFKTVSSYQGNLAGVSDAFVTKIAVSNGSLAVLSVTDSSFAEGNSGTSVSTFTVSLSQAASSNVSFDIATSDGTALAGSDYVARSLIGQVIPAGQTSLSFTPTINGDAVVEQNETFNVKLSKVTGAIIGQGQALGNIINDDGPTLSVTDVSVAEGNSGTKTFTFTVNMSMVSGSTVTYNIATANGSATAGIDYVSKSLTAESMAPGITSKTFVVTVNGDTSPEYSETFNVQLSNSVGATIADAIGVGTIVNDDVPTLSITDAAFVEGNSATKVMTFTVSMSGITSTPVTYNIATANGTATGGSDFVASSLTAQTIAAGANSATFAVTVNGDTTVEANETFAVNISAVSGATIADGQGIGTITNDDGSTLSIADVSVTEGNSGTKIASFTVKLSVAASTAVTYNIATAAGTATVATDYVASSLTGQTIAAGSTSKVFSVTVNGDTAIESSESFLVNVSNVTGVSVLDGQATGTIVNDDFPNLTIADVSITEGNSGTKVALFTVKLSTAASGPVKYDIATTAVTATAGTDYVAAKLVGETIQAGTLTKTFSVTLKGDTTAEPNETFTVNITNLSGANPTDVAATGTITNDD